MRIALTVMLIIMVGSASSMAGPREWGSGAVDVGAKAVRGTESIFSRATSLTGSAFMEVGRKTGQGASAFGVATGNAFMKTGETLGKFVGIGGMCVGRFARTFGRKAASASGD